MIIKLSNINPYPIPESMINESQVWGRDFLLNKPDKILISAESGKGKTTLINILLGSRKDYSGEVYINDKNIKNYNLIELSELRKNRLSIVPQGLLLFEHLSAIENIQIKNQITKKFSEKQIDDFLFEFGIFDQKDKKAGLLSYGQKQRLAIIRAFCQDYDFLLLDEPFSHLDSKNKEVITKVILNQLKEQSAGMIFTSLREENKDIFTHKLFV